MNERQSREIQSIRRAYSFLSQQSGLSPELTAATAKLERIVKRLEVLPASLVRARMPQGDATVRALANQFRERHMLPVSRRGRVLFRGEPRLERAMRVPHKHDSVTKLLAAARAMLRAVTPHKKHFIAAGSRDTFLTEYRAALARLSAADKESAKANVVAPPIRRELVAEIARGRDEVSIAAANIPIWASTRRDGAGLLAAWRGASRVGARLGRPSARRVRNRDAAERKRKGSTDV